MDCAKVKRKAEFTVLNYGWISSHKIALSAAALEARLITPSLPKSKSQVLFRLEGSLEILNIFL